MQGLGGFFRALIRTQRLESCIPESQLKRCLSTLDLTFLGIGSTLGLGIYVIAGQVASTKAGPAVTISFAIAAIASVFAGLCYAEFGARVPRAGSAYVYSYVTVGELMAFIIGWNLILEYVIGAASVARGYSGYIDFLANKTIEETLKEVVPIDIPNISEYPDFLAFGILIILTITLCFGVQISSKFNSVFTVINLLIVLFAVISGLFKADIQNWTISKENISEPFRETAGEGGFMPFGITGLMKGAATCFYAFIGFDVIATTGEETKNPQRAIPIGIVVSLLVVFLAYFSVSAVETLMVPYYKQDQSAPLPYVFDLVGWPVHKMIISIGALAGLSTSLLCSMFPLPRILYAMASDGLIFRFLANVSPRFQTPILATLISGAFAGVMAMMFNVRELADMMSIGTLLAYSLVAISVIILRYRYEPVAALSRSRSTITENGHSLTKKNSQLSLIGGKKLSSSTNGGSSYGASSEPDIKCSFKEILLQIFNLPKLSKPTRLSSKVSTGLVVFTCIVIVILDALLVFTEEYLSQGHLPALVSMCVMLIIWLLSMTALWTQPSSPAQLSFKVPFVPFVPFLSVTVNIYLMLQLAALTWIRFAVWMAVGLSIYFLYGIWNSSLRYGRPQAVEVPSISQQVQLEEQDKLPSENQDSDLEKPVTRL